MAKVTVAILADSPIGAGRDVSQLSLDELVRLEPRADAMLRAVRGEIGNKINAERMRLDLSLEQVRDMTNREIDSAGLSRLERGLAWSSDVVTKVVAFLGSQSRKAAKREQRATARAGR